MRFSRLIVASRTPGLGKESSKIVVAGGGVWNDMVGSGNAISLENTRCSGVVLILQCLQYGGIKYGGGFGGDSWWVKGSKTPSWLIPGTSAGVV